MIHPASISPYLSALMLSALDGSVTDGLNYACQMLGDGPVMDAFRRHYNASADADRTAELADIKRLAIKVKAYKERKYILGDLDVVPDFECPACHYHGYAAGAKLLALDKGKPLPCNGYGIWEDEDFVSWYKRRYPELCYHEAPRNARIIVNDTAPFLRS